VRALTDRLGVALDFVSDLAMLCFASWTLVAYMGMLTEARVTVLVPLWLATTPFLAAGLVLLRRRSISSGNDARSPEIAAPPEEGARNWPSYRTLLLVGLVAGLIGALLAASSRVPWALAWLPVAISAAAVVAAGKLRSRAPRVGAEAVGWVSHAFAAAVGIAFGVMSLFIARGNADDVFYVNRAAAVRQLDHIPVLDVIFTHEEVARGGGAGLPNDTFSALEGALARVVGVEGPSMAYYVFPPVFTFLATWAVWRLVRTWAPRQAWLCFALASAFILWSAQYPLTSGNYFLNRMWHGKVVLVAWAIPTIYVYLTRWLGKRDALTAVLLLAAGFATIGLTGSATFVTPLVVLGALIPLAARLEWAKMPIPLLAGAIPFVIGMGILLRFPLSETVGQTPLQEQSWFYHQVVGSGFVGAIAAFGALAAPWIVSSGPAGRMTAGIVVVFAILTVPGMILFLSDVSGLSGTLRRTLWAVPFPVLVGLLAAVPVATRLGKLLPAATAVGISLILVLFGSPLWTSFWTGESLWRYPPSWKIRDPEAARAVLRHYDGTGPILADRGIMTKIAIMTSEPKTINPRTLYLIRTNFTRAEIDDRLLLTRFVTGRPPPSTTALGPALDRLDVGLVCLASQRRGRIDSVRSLGTYEPAFRTSGETCLRRVPAVG
jgi:Family of unknown function (DUF6077)